MVRFIPALAACATILTVSSAYAQDDVALVLRYYVEDEVSPWAQDPTIIAAVKAQNARTQGLSADEIIALDTEWRAEVDTDTHPLVDSVLNNAASDLLRDKATHSMGTIAEVFVMDAQGLNVAASAATSDYWQGDEDKHQQTYSVGPDAMHFGELEVDGSTGLYQAQVSFTLVDPDTGEAIGALTVGVNADSLL